MNVKNTSGVVTNKGKEKEKIKPLTKQETRLEPNEESPNLVRDIAGIFKF